LPTANYESQKGLRRNASHHALLKDLPLSARGDLIMRNNLAVIPESREEINRSVGMRRTKSTEKVAREIRGVAKPPIKQSDKEYKK
jgi:oligoribonuclease NrnB/cAMP/cGMP phosphodiesterase (DHH superfamily)